MTYEPGHPGYTGADLVADAVDVLDAYGIPAVPDRCVPAVRLHRDVERSRDVAAARNHDLLAEGTSSRTPLSAITTPTLVIHGTADPMFPVEHGAALAREIPGARLLRLEGAGHGVDPADREMIAAAIIQHTARKPYRRFRASA